MQEFSLIETIAKSQFVWTIVALVMGFGAYKAVRHFVDRIQTQNDKREEQLIALYESQKEESKEREEKLMTHLTTTGENQVKMTDTMADIHESVKSLQEEMATTNKRVDEVYSIIKLNKKEGQA